MSLPSAGAKAVDAVLTEIQDVVKGIDGAILDRVAAEIRQARRVFLGGTGRSGLVVRMLATRLLQLGFDACVAGDTMSPAIGPEDLLIACSGTGETDYTHLFATRAVDTGARVVAMTTAPQSRLARAATLCVIVPVNNKEATPEGNVRSVQIGASLFEQAAFILLEAVVATFTMDEPDSETAFRSIHSNME